MLFLPPAVLEEAETEIEPGMSVTCTPEPALLCSVAFVPSHPQVLLPT